MLSAAAPEQCEKGLGSRVEAGSLCLKVLERRLSRHLLGTGMWPPAYHSIERPGAPLCAKPAARIKTVLFCF